MSGFRPRLRTAHALSIQSRYRANNWAATKPTLTNDTEDRSPTGGLFCLDSYIGNLTEEIDEPDTHGGTSPMQNQSWSSSQGIIGARSYNGTARCGYSTETTKESAILIQFSVQSIRATTTPYRVHYVASTEELSAATNRGFLVNASIYKTNAEGAQVNVQEATPVFWPLAKASYWFTEHRKSLL
ncbi:hypothetical protein ARMGADRAFT_1040255 [Armillaria gallica]|uniref:Uncharacterized protein n=1 Tax=Armillaria gallica TaxID=47427 RepID=A0A2H3CAQ2_ARMGA|nr:hypothetical protein ARMGADRAFT_1040255 [Armillaria gallica]